MLGIKNNPQAVLPVHQTMDPERLTLRLGDAYYEITVPRVLEIRGWEQVTRVPNQPGYMKGVFNLRGSVVPVFDLRQWLGMPAADSSEQAVIIILKVNYSGGQRMQGVIADAVPGTRSAPEPGKILPLDLDRLLDQDFSIGRSG